MAEPQPQVDGLSCDARNTVVVTGFGPFKKHPVNASWEAVKLLPLTGIEDDLGICLVLQQLPVSYEEVEKRIPMLWKAHNPLLVVHVGVSEKATKITLEKVAGKCGYDKEDICGSKPANNECCFGTSPAIYSTLNLNQLSNHLNTTSEVQTCTSENAGRLYTSAFSNVLEYLCEYTYYSSLSVDHTRSLFVHVPPVDKPYSARQMAEGLSNIICSLVKELRSKPQDNELII